MSSAHEPLRARFSLGVFWTAADTYATALLNFAVTLLLARFLDSRDFGLATGSTVLTLFFVTLADGAGSSAIVQRRGATHEELSSAFWGSVILLTASYVVIFAASPFVAALANVPELSAILRVGALQLPILGALVVPLGLLRGRMDIRPSAIAQVVAVISAGAVAIVLAIRGAGYWALVLQGIVLALVRALIIWSASTWRPAAVCRVKDLRPFARYAGDVAGFTVVNYWSRNVDVMLIGRFFGASAVGHFNLAYRLVGMPIQLVSTSLRLLHPALIEMNGDHARMRKAYFSLVRVTALVTFPSAVLLWCAADWLVVTLWGTEWQPAAAMLKALALLGAVQPVHALSGPVYLATESTRRMLGHSLGQALALIAGMMAGLRFGPPGVPLGYALTYAIFVWPIISGIAVRQLLHGRLIDLARALRPGLVLAAAIAAAALLVGRAGIGT